jgi:hypothetical protein
MISSSCTHPFVISEATSCAPGERRRGSMLVACLTVATVLTGVYDLLVLAVGL